MVRSRFAKTKTYYLKHEQWKLKFIDQNLEGYYNFKVTEHDDKECDWEAYATKDGSEILEDRKEWLESIKVDEPEHVDRDIKLVGSMSAPGEEI